MQEYRIENDAMGPVRIPQEALWGPQTQRAVENFGVSPLRIPVPMIRALATVKAAASQVNKDLALVDESVSRAIFEAASEVIDGKFDDQFPIDVFQTGSGTSWNMNMNEILARRAAELIGSGVEKRVHPNDHVNKGQSSNDVIPTSTNIANRIETDGLINVTEELGGALQKKSEQFKDVLKLGRTHLQDAVPMTLGQEFSGFASQIMKSAERLRRTFGSLEELALGGTALGTGINTHPEFAERAIAKISEMTGVKFKRAENAFEAIAARDSQLELMGAINSLATALYKIAQDLRLLSSGPRSGFGEINLPSLQPGSSIMPGKINPVIPEMVIQVSAHIMGKYLSVTIGCQNSPLELNIMQPLLCFETLSAVDLLKNTVEAFKKKCVDGIEANEKRCREAIDASLALITPLALKIGYDKASKIAYKAYHEGLMIRDIVVKEGYLSEKEASEILDPGKMIGPRA